MINRGRFQKGHKINVGRPGNSGGRGKIVSQEVREKIRNSLRGKYRGENSSNWQGGKSSQSKILRDRVEYKEWRTAVFTRDNWTCQTCGVRGVALQAHHIKPFAYFPELIFDINNGVTLCIECHKQTDSYLAKAKKYQLRRRNLW